MNKTERKKQDDFTEKILKGLDEAYKKLIEYKRNKNSELVIMQDGKIVKIKP